jgi:transposase-like protein
MAIIEAYRKCDVCDRKFVDEVTDTKKEALLPAQLVCIQTGEGVFEYDVCTDCVSKFNLKNGREVVLTTHRLA